MICSCPNCFVERTQIMKFLAAPTLRARTLLLTLCALTLCALTLCALTLGGCKRAPAPPPFDVPALVGQPIEALTKILGAPAQSDATSKTWMRADVTLSATYKPNGRVTALTLTSRDAKDAVREGEQDKLLQPGTLKSSDPRYSVDWIEAPDKPLYYNGVRVVPAPKTYAVELRVSGSQSTMLQLSYSIGGPQPQSQSLLTIAPWNLKANVPDDTQIMLQTRLVKAYAPGQSPTTVEIVVDGQVVASKTASVVAFCQTEL